jgi:hypothetical protein
MSAETRITTPKGGQPHDRIFNVLRTIYRINWFDYYRVLVCTERWTCEG